MKQPQFITIVALLFVMQIAPVSARGGDTFTKEKKFSRHFNVQSSTALKVDNQYGQVHINTWDNNEITVEINMAVTTEREEKAQAILDDIKIEEGSNDGGSEISFKTVFPKMNKASAKDMKVDYIINMPKKNPLDITNKFGDVFLGDFGGKLSVNMSYGALNAQKISGADKHIIVSFGSADIAIVESGIFDISYSKLTVGDAQNITVTNKFGKSMIRSVKELDIIQSYGDLEIGTAGKVKGTVDYAGMSIDKLTKSADMKLKYCSRAGFGAIGPGVDFIDLKASYSSIACRFDEGADLSIDVKGAYSNMKNQVSSSSFEFAEIRSGSYSSTQVYRGKAGHGNGKMSVDLKYGDLTFK